ncbi:MAG: putative ABC transporter permease [Lachnospiraceae bacterium]|nr:putative ABC transporter permease [Lachnospiraceae bacterium]
MYYYHFQQWLAFFYFYCVFGWCFETCYVSAKNKKLINRGFMKGPWLPIYGSGAICVLFVTLPVKTYPVLVYFVGMISATILEYIIGTAMLAFFKVRYWDYSYRKIQLHGHICLVSSLAWGVLSLLLIYVVHKPFSDLVVSLNLDLLGVIVFCFTLVFVFDFAYAFRTAMDLRAMILQAEHLRKEMQVRRDWQIAYMREDMENKMRILNLRREYLLEFWGEKAEEKLLEFHYNMGMSALTTEMRLKRFEWGLEKQIQEIQERHEKLIRKMLPHASHNLIHNPGYKLYGLKKESKKLKELALKDKENK